MAPQRSRVDNGEPSGVVTGTQTRVMDLEPCDVGDDTVEVNPP